jgi:hypothetical protein
LVLEAVDISLELRKRQTTAQSSILEVGYLYLQARTANSTSVFAAEERDGTDPTMSTTSLFESTSQIYNKLKQKKIHVNETHNVKFIEYTEK